jgi:4-nitrophenyl phosphatase
MNGEELVLSLKGLLIDLDGSIYKGNTSLHYSREFIEFLRKVNIKFLFLTNNSTQLPMDYVNKLRNMDIETKEEEILTSGIATAIYLSSLKNVGNAYVIGEEALKKAIISVNWKVLEDADYVDAVVVGLDRSFNFEKLRKANYLIRNGAKFIATNPDKTFPMENRIDPGAGSLVAAVSAASEKKPIVIGKPSPYIGKIALSKLGLKSHEVGIVGDRLDTDILFGKRLKIKTFLVLTGISKREDMEKSKIKPDFVFENLEEMTMFLKGYLENKS